MSSPYAPPEGFTCRKCATPMLTPRIRIFEHTEGASDCLRLLVGRLPQSKTGPAAQSADNSFPLSPHYARLLADLALERGFDGYLLNVEVPLVGRAEQARALAAWIAVLDSELKHKVGSHAETIWYAFRS